MVIKKLSKDNFYLVGGLIVFVLFIVLFLLQSEGSGWSGGNLDSNEDGDSSAELDSKEDGDSSARLDLFEEIEIKHNESFKTIYGGDLEFKDECLDLSRMVFFHNGKRLKISFFPENEFCRDYGYDLNLYGRNYDYQVRIVPCDRGYAWRKDDQNVIPFGDMQVNADCSLERIDLSIILPEEIFMMDQNSVNLKKFNETGDMDEAVARNQFKNIYLQNSSA